MIVYPLESWLKLDRTQQNKLVSDHFPLDAKKKKTRVWEIYGSNQDVGFVQRNKALWSSAWKTDFFLYLCVLAASTGASGEQVQNACKAVLWISSLDLILEKKPRATEMPLSLSMLISEIFQHLHRMQDDLGLGSFLPLACGFSLATHSSMVLLIIRLSLLEKAYPPVRISSASARRSRLLTSKVTRRWPHTFSAL